MSTQSHNLAAEAHEAAVKSHTTAADHHKTAADLHAKGDHKAGLEHAQNAAKHGEAAHKAAGEALDKSKAASH